MAEQLTGNPHEYIQKMLEASSDKKTPSKESHKTESFWTTDCPRDAFESDPRARESILYKPVNN